MIVWNAGFDVGHEDIDRQHKRLVEITNRIMEAAKKPGSEAEMLPAFNALVDYTVKHFAMEEKLMAQHRYPDAAAHKQQHASLIKGVEELLAAHNAKKTMLGTKAIMFLQDWLVNHIQKTDKKLGAFLKTKQQEPA